MTESRSLGDWPRLAFRSRRRRRTAGPIAGIEPLGAVSRPIEGSGSHQVQPLQFSLHVLVRKGQEAVALRVVLYFIALLVGAAVLTLLGRLTSRFLLAALARVAPSREQPSA